MSDPWFKTAFGLQYPLLYRHRNQAEALQCLQLVLGMVPLGLKGTDPTGVLDLGCGDGRHLQALSQQATCNVFGLDYSLPLLQLAKQKVAAVNEISLIQGDMRCLPFPENSLSAVFSLFTAFGYFGPLADNECVIKGIARVLAPGGHWYLDYFDCQKIKEELGDGLPKSRSRVEGPLEISEVRFLNSTGDQVRKTVTMKPVAGMELEARQWGIEKDGITYTEEVAVFSRHDINELAERSHLVPVATAGSYDGLPLGKGDRWIMVFRKAV